MKNLKVFLLIGVLVLSFIGGSLIARNALVRADEAETAPAQDVPKGKHINVSAMGKIEADPDVAYLTLGISEQAETAKEASELCNSTMQNIYDTLEKLGVEKGKIKTVGYYMNPMQNWESDPPTIYAYRAENQIEITVNDIDRAGEVLAAALDAGANTVSDVRFDVLDKTEAYREALSKAVKSAQDKAKVMAEAAGVSVDEIPVMLTEGQLNDYSYMIRNNYSFNMVEAVTKDAAGAVPLSGNRIEITAYVEAVYEMK